ncbi:60S ribosomal protein L27-like [Drosophila subobscura]|uniref:60S ribosomal protein L27-like n=1 Tax=Drosophila subobscura TaxID=7241 RepID=UPI00155AAB2C|nr:60S ribosomal protein L27-like [Drosophila subobscura]
MPTRYTAHDISFEKLSPKDLKDPVKSKTHRFQTRVKFDSIYKEGKNKWFFQKLRF